MKKLIVHIAEIDLSKESGMGRIAWHWKSEFERRGYEFCHIGLKQVGKILHPGMFPYAARHVYKQLSQKASILMVHEPASGIFLPFGIPTVLFSHGLEQRAWNLKLQGKDGTTKKLKWRTKFLFPLWRLHQCNLGLKKADLLLLSNQEDCDFAQQYYYRESKHLFLFRNGIHTYNPNETIQTNDRCTVLFMGSWIERKGIKTLVEAAQILQKQNLQLNWLLAGTTSDRDTILNFWPSSLHPFLEIIPRFQVVNEPSILSRSQIFVLPSFFEGQPLALLQAMEAGLCCITTNCCGQKDLIHDHYNGLLHEPGDSQSLASLIAKCVTNKQLRISLGKNAKASVQNRTWKDVSAELVDRVEVLLHKK